MGFKPIPAATALVLALLTWFIIPAPQGVSSDAWYLLALFVDTIADIVGKAIPIGAMAILGITLVALTSITNEEAANATKDVLSSLSSSLIWMIGIAIVISRGLLRTGLDMHIGYLLTSLFGKRMLGIGCSLVLADLVIDPVTPNNIARGGAIVHPIMKSTALNFDSDPERGTEGKIGKYLPLVNFHSNVITCLVFITTTAPNLLVVESVAKATNTQIQLSWSTQFLTMVVPSLIAMPLMPLMLCFLYPPEIKQTSNATTLAKEHLAITGPMEREEKTILGIFLVLLLLWAGTPKMLFGVKVDATTTTFLGLSLCLPTGILTWDDALKEKGAWDIIVWFVALVIMADFLNKLGLISWLSGSMQNGIIHMGSGWGVGCALLVLAYLYAHYVFTNDMAHVAATLGTFYGIGLALSTPPMLFALIMAAITSIVMSLTHYATGSASVTYGSNCVSMIEQWKVGFIMNVVEVLIFNTVDILQWKALDY